MNVRVLPTLTMRKTAIFDTDICFSLATALVRTLNQYKCPFCTHTHIHTHIRTQRERERDKLPQIRKLSVKLQGLDQYTCRTTGSSHDSQ